MENSIQTKHADILNTQTSTEKTNTNNSNSNYERQQIEHTPFWVIGDPENGYNLIMGKWKLTTEPHKTKNDLKLWMNKNKWNIILSMIICATHDIKILQDYKIQGDSNPPVFKINQNTEKP